MIRNRTLQAREKLIGKLPVTAELLRGSLLERTVRHTKDCPKCARGEGHRVFVLTVTYAGGRTQQFSVRRERVAEVRRWLDNYQKLKQAIENICELNHELLRPAPHRASCTAAMIEMRRAQMSFGDGLIAEEVSELREGWMEHADRVLHPRGRREDAGRQDHRALGLGCGAAGDQADSRKDRENSAG